MTDLTIHQFRYFLEDLQNNLQRMEILCEELSILLNNSHYPYNAMSDICRKLIEQSEK